MFTFPTPKQTPESYTQKLKEALGHRLLSVVLYGSAVSGEHREGQSDYNLMLMAEHWGILELNLLSKVTQDWLKEGNPPPLLFTTGRLQASADCFPIEMLDMKQSYRILHGEDVLKPIRVQPVHLRLIIERELKSLKIQMRQTFVFAEGKPEKVAELLTHTLSSMLVLMRAALRLYTDAVPANKYEALPAIAEHVKGVDTEAFTTVRKLKNAELKLSEVNPLQLFERVMNSLTAVADNVDQRGIKG